MQANRITEAVIGAAITIHKALGPGLLESAYKACLAHELAFGGISVELEKPLPLIYRNMKMECAYRLDMLLNDR